VSNTIKMKWDMKIFQKINGHELDSLQKFIAANLQTNRAMIFDHEGAYNGRAKWKGLAFRKGMILSKSGDLRRSIAPRNNGITPKTGAHSIVEMAGGRITIGSDLIYANIQDQGGTISAKNKALKIPVGTVAARGRVRIDGNWYIFRKKVTIPKRSFTDWTKEDEQEITESVTNYLKDMF
jgi:phage gpG-like protein